jgi:hypothetical protein
MLSHRTCRFQSTCFLLHTLLAFAAMPTFAAEQPRWRRLESELKSAPLCLWTPTVRPIRPESPFFVVTHGMGGTSDGDRFHRLADTISSTCPSANVLLIDWSEASCARTKFFNLPYPQAVAGKIDRVGEDAAEMLCELGFDPDLGTFIGESFGNWVNARIANEVGGVRRVLAMNPASELGGYRPPDLSACARTSWSFHTYSIFDTLLRISQASILLETRPGSSEIDRHTCGIGRLTSRLERGDRSWLFAEVNLRDASDTSFHTLATLDGQLVNFNSPRMRPTPTANSTLSENDIQQTLLSICQE